MTDNRANSPRQTRVLFLAWGFSIHAKRRIQLFVDAQDFAVAVVSTCNYNFANAQNILLTGAHGKKEIGDSFAPQNEGKVIKRRTHITRTSLGKLVNKIKTGLYGRTLLLPLIFCYEIYKGVKDFKILKSSVMEFNPDVVFLQTLLYPCYLTYFLPRSFPIIITFWNGDVVWWAKRNGIERLLKKQIVTYGVRRAQAITVNSQMAFNACLGYGIQAEKIHLIRYPGVDLERFKPFAKNEARKKLGITYTYKKVVLCPRGLGGFLNSDVIVESAANVVKKYPETLFLFISGVGGEKELKKHQQKVRELGMEKNFRWEGQVPWDMMTMYYSSSDVMVSISSNDSLPNCMLEAMVCGLPVIMGDIPQIREWVTDGVNGFLVPPRESVALSCKILRVFENTDGLIDSFIRKNRGLVIREFDSVKNIERVKGLVRTITKK
ncbi:MAG: glycosyltransferase family 1 protein [Nitrospirae bacterium]|nr:MAG: glycosyltransferase family 1 protein [Nitrospirota bacterium]